MIRIFEKVAIFVAVAFLAATINPAQAQKISLIRDSEIENTIRQWLTPVFRAAELEPSAIKFFLVQDNAINAFVTGGQNIFINTGLLTRATNASQIIGVLAHETGHISGGHLARIHDALDNAAVSTILSLLLGGAAIGAGRGDVGGAIISAGQNVSLRSLLQYTRTQESSADAAGMSFLDKAGMSSQGLLDFFKILGDQELVPPEQQDPYVQTHPLTRDRMIAVEHHIANSPLSGKSLPPEYDVSFRRIKAKLYGFLNPYSLVIRVYKESDNSLDSRYARAIASYRKPDLAIAVPLVDGLIAEMPDDPYFWELKGQMLFENADVKGALPAYEKAASLLPTSALIRTDLARAQMATNDPGMLDAAIENLKFALSRDRTAPFVWNQLAIAYGRKGDKGHGSLAMAEEALLRGRKSEARYHAGFAVKVFPTGSREWLQAQDILIAAQDRSKEKKR
jgi:predicted Zn-dependent protease